MVLTKPMRRPAAQSRYSSNAFNSLKQSDDSVLDETQVANSSFSQITLSKAHLIQKQMKNDAMQ